MLPVSPQIMRLGMTALVALRMDDEAVGVVVPLTTLTESEAGPAVFVVDPTNDAVRKNSGSSEGITAACRSVTSTLPPPVVSKFKGLLRAAAERTIS